MRSSNGGPQGEIASRRALDPDAGDSVVEGRYRTAFPVGNVIRILEHNGEPLSWVRSLGFDAVLLSRPPDKAILSEAIRSQILLYAPPPSSPDPSIESMLEPVAGWYVGSGEAMDSRHVDQVAIESKRLRGWPERWQRPIIGAPSETWRDFAPLLDGIIDDLPPRVRGLQPSEEVAQMVFMRRPDRRSSGIRGWYSKHAAGESDAAKRKHCQCDRIATPSRIPLAFDVATGNALAGNNAVGDSVSIHTLVSQRIAVG